MGGEVFKGDWFIVLLIILALKTLYLFKKFIVSILKHKADLNKADLNR